MIKKIYSLNIIKNSSALFIMQVVNIGIPLLMYPFLSRQLGIESFGLLMICFSVCAIGVVITDFGFGLSATKSISKNRDNKDFVSKIIGAVFIIKSFILCSLLFILVCYEYFIGLGFDYRLIFFILINIVVQSFIPTWFFLGIEKMKNITFFMIFTKLVYVFLVLYLVNEEDEMPLVILLQAISYSVAVTIALALIYRNKYQIILPNSMIVKEIFRDSTQFFYSRVTLSLYTSASTLFVGAFSGAQQAALFGAAEKLYLASQSITSSIAQALFPYMANDGKKELLGKIIILVGIPLGIFCVLLGFWGSEIMDLIFGDGFSNGGPILQVFLIITLINFVGVNLGFPAFASIDKIHIANYTVVLGALMHIIFLGFLYFSNNVSGINVVIAVLITELSIMSVRFYMFQHYSR